ncbi:MAG: hypothetical protein R3F19_09395 [Verrucomicrobiales bacterium]
MPALADTGALLAAFWVRRQEVHVCKLGDALSAEELKLARLVGVQFPERVRLLGVEKVPFPLDGLTKWLARLHGNFPTQALGLTARYGIYLQSQSRWNVELIVHELVHTSQYEKANGILGFLRQYLRDCLKNGYSGAEMEQEARNLSICALRRSDKHMIPFPETA